jgi:hypothetical protein
MKPTMKVISPLLPIVLAGAFAQVAPPVRPTVHLESPTAAVTIDLGGGSIVDFHLPGGISPLHWIAPEDESQPLRPMAHFLCLDRWGPPSDAEMRNGMPFHGEASRVQWRQVGAAEHLNGQVLATMEATLPLAGLEVRRTVALSESASVFTVSETVTNLNKLGRIYNMVQHATIGPPFLDETTVVDTNGGEGFMQTSPLPDPERIVIHWPQAIKDGKPVDLRRLIADPDPNVASFVIDGDLGWAAATNASQELLFGYIFRTADYPWVNLWRYSKDGRPMARGLEFGTTGFHQPFRRLLAKPQIFGRPTFAYLDTGESATRMYTAFLLKVPRDFAGVNQILYREGKIVIQERAEHGRELTMAVDRLF